MWIIIGASGEEDSEEEERSSTRPTSSGVALADAKSKESSGTKRKAEVLSTESGKIGVTITTNHAHKSPRMTSPSRSPSYADNFIKSLHLTPVSIRLQWLITFETSNSRSAAFSSYFSQC